MKEELSYSFNSAVELGFGNGLIDDHVFVSSNGNISVGIELCGFLSVDVSKFLLLLIVGKLR
jgi:hypothetical protein